GARRREVVGHAAIDLVGERDEARLVALEPYLPRQVVRVGRKTVATESGPGIERHEAERLGGGGRDHLPHRELKAPAHDGELVHQPDVDRTERGIETRPTLR